MAFDFKKEYKEYYAPKNKPGIVTVPSMNYIAVHGQGIRMRRAANTSKRSVCSTAWHTPSK